MYISPDFKTKKALREALAAGKPVYVLHPDGILSIGGHTGMVAVEGPHDPRPHTWYASVRIEGDRVIKVLS